MGFGKFLLGGLGVVGAIVAAPVVLPAAAAVAATGAATAAAVGGTVAAGAAAVGSTAAAVGGTVATGAVAVGSTAATVGGTALGLVGNAVGNVAGAVGISSVATAAAGSTAGATAIGATTVGATVGGANIASGANKMKEAKELSDTAQIIQKESIDKLTETEKYTNEYLDSFAEKEIVVFSNFKRFSDLFEKIKNRPKFEDLNNEKFNLPKVNISDVKDVLFVLEELKNLSASAATGVLGAIVSTGITTSAVSSFAAASTGTAISSLHGVAASNAILASLGGGALNAGGGGMALGQTVLGATTAGVGLLVGGIMFNVNASHSKEKSEKIYNTVLDNRYKIDKICDFMSELKEIVYNFEKTILKVGEIYVEHLNSLEKITSYKTNYDSFYDNEKLLLENTVHLTTLLYSMGKVKIVEKLENSEIPTINTLKINESISKAKNILEII